MRKRKEKQKGEQRNYVCNERKFFFIEGEKEANTERNAHSIDGEEVE